MGIVPGCAASGNGRRRSEHSEERRAEGRRTGPAFSDAQRANHADVAWDTDTDRFVVRGPRGRYQIFEASGEHVTQVDYPARTWNERRRHGRWAELTEAQWTWFARVFRK